MLNKYQYKINLLVLLLICSKMKLVLEELLNKLRPWSRS